MYTLSHSVPANPVESDVVLSHDDLWAALVLKAEDATSFVPAVKRCEVNSRRNEDGIDSISRTVFSDQGSSRERVALLAPSQLHFALVDMGGFIENTISTSDDGLMLTFTFGVVKQGAEPGSSAEREKALAEKGNYIATIEATLERARDLKRSGQLS